MSTSPAGSPAPANPSTDHATPPTPADPNRWQKMWCRIRPVVTAKWFLALVAGVFLGFWLDPDISDADLREEIVAIKAERDAAKDAVDKIAKDGVKVDKTGLLTKEDLVGLAKASDVAGVAKADALATLTSQLADLLKKVDEQKQVAVDLNPVLTRLGNTTTSVVAEIQSVRSSLAEAEPLSRKIAELESARTAHAKELAEARDELEQLKVAYAAMDKYADGLIAWFNADILGKLGHKLEKVGEEWKLKPL